MRTQPSTKWHAKPFGAPADLGCVCVHHFESNRVRTQTFCRRGSQEKGRYSMQFDHLAGVASLVLVMHPTKLLSMVNAAEWVRESSTWDLCRCLAMWQWWDPCGEQAVPFPRACCGHGALSGWWPLLMIITAGGSPDACDSLWLLEVPSKNHSCDCVFFF